MVFESCNYKRDAVILKSHYDSSCGLFADETGSL